MAVASFYAVRWPFSNFHDFLSSFLWSFLINDVHFLTFTTCVMAVLSFYDVQCSFLKFCDVCYGCLEFLFVCLFVCWLVGWFVCFLFCFVLFFWRTMLVFKLLRRALWLSWAIMPYDVRLLTFSSILFWSYEIGYNEQAVQCKKSVWLENWRTGRNLTEKWRKCDQKYFKRLERVQDVDLVERLHGRHERENGETVGKKIKIEMDVKDSLKPKRFVN